MSNIMEVVFIIDRSGSMSGQESDIIGGFNAMLAHQSKEDYQALISTVLFDNHMKRIHDRVPLAQVPTLTAEDYQVRGCTALLDAIGSSIDHIKTVHHYARPEDRPAKTLFVIMTDGLENASRRYSGAQIRKRIREQEESGWEFMFIGADIDVFASADDVGIRRSRSFGMSKETDSFVGCLDAVGDVMQCAATSPKPLQDQDWEALVKIFSKKSKR